MEMSLIPKVGDVGLLPAHSDKEVETVNSVSCHKSTNKSTPETNIASLENFGVAIEVEH